MPNPERAKRFADLMVSRGVEFGTYERDKNKEITIKPQPNPKLRDAAQALPRPLPTSEEKDLSS